MRKRKWFRSYSIGRDGFYGHLYRPEQNAFPGRVLLILGGGGMPYYMTMKEAEAFSEIGISALALGYFGVAGAPKTIIRVPLEYMEDAAACMHDSGFEKVIAVGISKGAELALAAASCFSGINGVIAFSPSSRVYMGIGRGISWVNASSWTFRGKELPYAYAPFSGRQALGCTLRACELTFRPVYERAIREAGEDSVIPAERIAGPVLLCAALSDSVWPSGEACREIAARLDEKGFSYPCRQLVYPYATHLLLPFETGYDRLFRIGRSHPEACRETARALQREVLEWLK